ncbi:putative baseplate protein [Xanthomonas phage Carpasina]|uniref:Phage protein Gp138 N-terminal domain-containing protein n=2 Tax=Carpasinavirus TaxID=2733099 RepID=A0A3S7L8G7_9CAUD|nr:baseplate spike [Xanthomonas phage Carpasina]YP_009819171.1 baseplate spike [Xanthomonas phage XcP1]AWD92423.1 putative baseplate protein [Xanthomonas phage Carpasina]AWN08529.1 hypothetical protein XcP1_027 [Xanthomonas phage XcP1]
MADDLKPLINSRSGERSRLWPALEAMMRQAELRSDQMMPAEVVSFDRAKNLVTVKPLIMWVTVEGNHISRHSIIEVPALSLGAGKFHISFPISKGDLGWIIAADRDLTLFKQTLEEAAPATSRAHKFDDSMFITDVFRKYTISEEDSEAMVIQSVDGATRVSIRQDNIKMTTTKEMLFDSPLSTFTKDVVVKGKLNVENGAVITNDAIVDGTSVRGHGHISSNPGTRTSNGMIP